MAEHKSVGLRFSILVLLGLVFGTGLAAAIVLDHFHWLLGEELGGGAMALMGVYLLLVGILGTWTSLGAFGTWAGRCGGRKLRFVIQVAGIVLAAWMTLPLFFFLTLALMWWKGKRAEA